MNEVQLNEFRITRLTAAVDRISQGNKTDFGRRLGYKDGAFVRQMLSGNRLISEKTVRAIEAMPGMRGWFDQDEGDSTTAAVSTLWPFPSIAEADVRSLDPGQLSALEGAMALAIAQLRLGINVAPPAQHAPRNHGGLANLDAAPDEFPMRVPGLPAPWEPNGVTTKQLEREQPLRISRAPNVGHVADSGYSANDHEFLPIPELDVRLAAGKLGIENYHETEIGEILLRRSFLESFKLPVERMKIVYADGDSMEPVIRHRSPMLFYQEEVTDPHQIDPCIVYAINHGGKMIVKCIKRERDGIWLAKSINRAYPPFPLEKEDGREVRIVGRILWSPYDLRNGVDERLIFA